MTDDELRRAANAEKEWWFPKRVDAALVARLRKDYPEDAELSDGDILAKYEYDGKKFATTWDHLGDAQDQFDRLADAYLKLRAAYLAEHPADGDVRMLPCFKCGKAIKGCIGDGRAGDPPNDAVAFIAHGNYGSTIYDCLPHKRGAFLEINICDECLLASAAISERRYNADRPARERTEIICDPWKPHSVYE